MIKLNPYLNFKGQTEKAFNFYKSVFGGEFIIFQRFKDVPNLPDKEKFNASDLDKIMHVSLKIGNDILMATDALDTVGPKMIVGNNISLSLSPDSKKEAEKLFEALQVGGNIDMPLMKMFWGDYFGMIEDAFGIKWMINFHPKK